MSTETKRRGQFGPLYKGHEGQYSWLLHRVSGLAIILFLFAHVVDTAVVGWGPDAYNRVASVYHNPFIRMLELGLVDPDRARPELPAVPHEVVRLAQRGSRICFDELLVAGADALEG